MRACVPSFASTSVVFHTKDGCKQDRAGRWLLSLPVLVAPTPVGETKPTGSSMPTVFWGLYISSPEPLRGWLHCSPSKPCPHSTAVPPSRWSLHIERCPSVLLFDSPMGGGQQGGREGGAGCRATRSGIWMLYANPAPLPPLAGTLFLSLLTFILRDIGNPECFLFLVHLCLHDLLTVFPKSTLLGHSISNTSIHKIRPRAWIST